MLSALRVHADGTVGEGYGQAILENYGGPLPGDLDKHAAQERLRCRRPVVPVAGSGLTLT
jgi:hypothetical protein